MHRPRRHAADRALVVVTLLGVLGVTVAGVEAEAPGTATRTVRALVGQITATRTPPEPAGLTYGVDYSFLRLVDGQPARWQCETTIPVLLVGPAPSGTERILAGAVDRLTHVTGLPLVAGWIDATKPTVGSTPAPSSCASRSPAGSSSCPASAGTKPPAASS